MNHTSKHLSQTPTSVCLLAGTDDGGTTLSFKLPEAKSSRRLNSKRMRKRRNKEQHVERTGEARVV